MIKNMIIVMSLALMIVAPFASAENVLLIQFDIDKNYTVSSFKASVIDGRPNPKSQGDCTVMIFGENDNVMYSSGYDLEFGVFDAPVTLDKMNYIDKIPYSSDMKKISVYQNGIPVFSEDLNLCIENDLCDENENYLSCPSDCPLDSEDGYCINAVDGVCDPDCLSGYDPDCEEESKNNCGDGICSSAEGEHFVTCPIDCSGAADGICDRREDGRCDPDCPERNDVDCQEEDESNPFIFPVIIIIMLIGVIAAFMSFRKKKIREQEMDQILRGSKIV